MLRSAVAFLAAIALATPASSVSIRGVDAGGEDAPMSIPADASAASEASATASPAVSAADPMPRHAAGEWTGSAHAAAAAHIDSMCCQPNIRLVCGTAFVADACKSVCSGGPAPAECGNVVAPAALRAPAVPAAPAMPAVVAEAMAATTVATTVATTTTPPTTEAPMVDDGCPRAIRTKLQTMAPDALVAFSQTEDCPEACRHDALQLGTSEGVAEDILGDIMGSGKLDKKTVMMVKAMYRGKLATHARALLGTTEGLLQLSKVGMEAGRRTVNKAASGVTVVKGDPMVVKKPLARMEAKNAGAVKELAFMTVQMVDAEKTVAAYVPMTDVYKTTTTTTTIVSLHHNRTECMQLARNKFVGATHYVHELNGETEMADELARKIHADEQQVCSDTYPGEKDYSISIDATVARDKAGLAAAGHTGGAGGPTGGATSGATGAATAAAAATGAATSAATGGAKANSTHNASNSSDGPAAEDADARGIFNGVGTAAENGDTYSTDPRYVECLEKQSEGHRGELPMVVIKICKEKMAALPPWPASPVTSPDDDAKVDQVPSKTSTSAPKSVAAPAKTEEEKEEEASMFMEMHSQVRGGARRLGRKLLSLLGGATAGAGPAVDPDDTSDVDRMANSVAAAEAQAEAADKKHTADAQKVLSGSSGNAAAKTAAKTASPAVQKSGRVPLNLNGQVLNVKIGFDTTTGGSYSNAELLTMSVAVVRVHDLGDFRILSHDRVSINPVAAAAGSGNTVSSNNIAFNAVIDCKDPSQGQMETVCKSASASPDDPASHAPKRALLTLYADDQPTPCCDLTNFESCSSSCNKRLEVIASLGVCMVGRTYLLVQFDEPVGEDFDPDNADHIKARAEMLDCGVAVSSVDSGRRRLLGEYSYKGGGTQVTPRGGEKASS